MIRNILKNGTEVADLTGYIVRESEAPEAYSIIRRGEGNEKEEQEKQNLEDDHSGGSGCRADIRLLS